MPPEMDRGRLKTGLGKICFQTVFKEAVEQIHANGVGYRVFVERLEKFLKEEVFL
ncbi:hypothetical protein [Neisseria sicca]|jgi:hypothetical protein|uniref:hypothetical protein n=1 Tax=Neisseria sicca TaxID=490 RepID=UPI001649A23E|nr:hypothetical protein [Neisseria sicca]